jgi:DNA-binding XRE family transcriptional regulator
MELNGNILRAIRSYLDMNREDFGEAVGIGARTIGQIEDGSVNPKSDTQSKILNYIRSQNLLYKDTGFEVMKASVAEYEGQSGFIAWMDDVYETIKANEEREICVNNVSERTFEKWLGYEADKRHMDRMAGLGDVRCKTLLEEGDTYFSSSEYALYKWIPHNLFGTVPFYVYGHKMAIILFEEDNVKVFVHQTPVVAKEYRRQFMMIWNNAIVPPMLEEANAK